jgi:hypothetical protein
MLYDTSHPKVQSKIEPQCSAMTMGYCSLVDLSGTVIQSHQLSELHLFFFAIAFLFRFFVFACFEI